MNATTAKRTYDAPDARRTRIRPLAPAKDRRRQEATWKDRAKAALAAPVEIERDMVITKVTQWEVREEAGRKMRIPVKHNWQWWQIVVPAIITVCAVMQLAQSVR